MGLSLSIGIGNTCGSVEKVALSYISMDAMLYGVVLGKNVVVDAEQKINASKENGCGGFDNILKNSEEDMVFALRNVNQEEAKKIIEQIMQASRQIAANDVHQKERIAFLLSVFIIRVIYSLEISNYRFYNKENDLYNEINELISIDDMKIFMLGIINEIIHAIEESDSKQNNFG